MEYEVVKTDFIDIVSASMLILKSESRREPQELIIFCWMVLFISINSYAPGGISISKQSVTILYSSRTIIFVLSLIFWLI